ncbi:hypothetical protein EIP86_008965 [Pleurotus ostreatoroseus]|nr:hypothetical protein EIP86_008965 [Pleurotus ostreatoroseus]
MPIGKGIITGAIDPHHTKGAIRAFALPMLSRPGDMEDAAPRSNAYLSAYSPVLTGTTAYTPSPVLTNLGKSSRAGSFSEQCRLEKNVPLSANDFEVLRCLGQGSYGQVFLVRHITTSQLLAMKVIDNRRLPYEKYGRIFEEQRIGKMLADSRWSLGIEGSFHDSNNFYLLFKYCTKGDLRRATWEEQNFFAQHPFKLIFAELVS